MGAVRDILYSRMGGKFSTPFLALLIKRLYMASPSAGPSYEELTVSGNAPLTLENAVAKAIKSLTQTGLCAQASTPTPSAPVDIKCNNGALRMVDDELPSGYTRLQSIESDGTDGYVTTGIVIDSADTDVEVDFQFLNTSASQPKMVWGYMDGASNIPRWGFGAYSSGWLGSPNATATRGSTDSGRHTAIMSVYERSGASYYNGTVDGVELYGETALGNVSLFEGNVLPLILFARNNKGTAGNFANAKIYRFKVTKANVLTHDLVPCKDDGGVLGFYDLVTGNFLVGSGTLTAGAVDYSHAHIDAVGTDEVLMLNGANLADMSESNLDIGYYINNNGVRTTGVSNFYTLGLIAVKPSTAYTMHTSASINYFNTMEYDASKGFIKRTLYGSAGNPAGDTITFTTGATTAFIRFGSNIDGTTLDYTKISAITWMLTVGSTAEAYEPYKSQTASVVNLLSVGTYADTQEIISGAVTRKVGMLVLDGTETWSTSSGVFYMRVSEAVTGYGRQAVVSTHYVGTDETNANMPDASMKTANNSGSTYLQLYCKDTSCANVTEFKAYLADQYAAGTPVIVLYPLATEIAESVDGQSLSTVAGANTVGVAAEVSPVALEAVYYGLEE